MSDQDPIDYSQPVAYDAQGRPLYAHPPAAPVVPPAIGVETVPAPEKKHPHGSTPEDINARHIESREKYPNLNLSEGEYVVEEIRRHPIGLAPIVGLAGLMVIFGLVLLLLYPMFEQSAPSGTLPPFNSIILPLSMVILLVVLIAYVATTVYNANRFFLTNESVIEEIQTTLFAQKEKTVGLTSIEEVTFVQTNMFQSMFNYGTVKMTIEGHTIYEFPYIGNPKVRVDLLVNTIEKRKAHAGHH